MLFHYYFIDVVSLVASHVRSAIKLCHCLIGAQSGRGVLQARLRETCRGYADVVLNDGVRTRLQRMLDGGCK